MPTSSQAIILQTNAGSLPPLFGRQNRKPTLPPGPQWTNFEQPLLPTPKLEILNDKQNVPAPRKHEKQRVHPQRKRTGSAPNLDYKLNFGTLSQVLSIRGIHGSVSFDQSSNSIRWKVNSIGPFYDRNERRFPKLGVNRPTGNLGPSRFRYTHADRINDPYRSDADRSGIDESRDMQMDLNQQRNYNDFRRKESFQANQQLKKHVTSNETHGNIDKLMNNIASAFIPLQDAIESGEYFKLVPTKVDNTSSSHDTLFATFELEKCDPNDTGAFQLSPTNSGDNGDFKLIPPTGVMSDKYRLYATPNTPGHFILLESDGSKSENYRPLFAQDYAEHIEYERGVSNVSQDKRRKRDIIIPREAWTQSENFGQDISLGQEVIRDNVHSTTRSNRPQQNEIRDNRHYNNDITQAIKRDGSTFGAPNAHVKDAWVPFNEHNYQQTEANGAQYNEMLRRSSNHTFNSENMQMGGYPTGASKINDHRGAYASELPDAFSANVRFDPTTSKPGDMIQYNEWGVRDFDLWSRTTTKPTYQEQAQPADASHRNSDTMATQKQRREDAEDMSEKSKSVINDIKYRTSYKLWKKRRISTLRMRKELPPSDPNAVCVKVEDDSLSHDEMKHSIETEIGCKLISLQFDPVLLNSFQGDSKYRWILRFANPSVCEALSLRGIHVNGIQRSVRRYDDVMREEYETYNFYESMKDIENKMTQKTAKKMLPKINLTNTTEAQTTTC